MGVNFYDTARALNITPMEATRLYIDKAAEDLMAKRPSTGIELYHIFIFLLTQDHTLNIIEVQK